MNIRTTFILAFILLLMSGYYYFFEVKATQEKMTKEDIEKKILDISQDKINSFEYKNKKENLDSELIQKGNDWYLEKPVSYKADNSNVTTVLDSLINAKYQEKIENPQKLEDFGLKEPNFTLALKTKDGEKLIKVGDKSPTETSLYIMKDKDPNIYLISGSSYYSLDKKLSDLRDKTIISFDKEKINSLKLKNANGDFVLKKQGSEWNLEAPQKFKADGSKVDELFTKLQNDKITDFVADKDDNLENYGLEKSPTIITLEDTDKSEKKILIGTETGDSAYVKIGNLPNIFKVSKATIEPFKADVLALRNKNILTLDSSKVNKIEIESVELKLVAEKDKDKKWGFASKDSKVKITPEDVSAFVDKLANLNFIRVFPIDKFTLGDRIINIKLFLESQSEPVKFSFGGVTTDNKEQVYLLKPGDKEGYSVAKNILEKIVSK